MVQDKRNLHLRLQEYCDCYLETDPREELDRISTQASSSDPTGDPEEVALKFLSLAVLYGIEENAKRLSIVKVPGGETQLNIEAAGNYKLPAPPRALTDQIFRVMRSITHLESGKGTEPLALGIQNDRLELGIEFDSAEEQETLTLSFPEM
jgi:hypothetical protein